MEELDLLKKNWQKDTHLSNQFSESDIYGMLHKKSSSIVKWIFIISLIEFGLGFVMNLIFSLTNSNKRGDDLLIKYGLYEVNNVLTILIYGVVLYFIYRFFKMYQNITTDTNTKDLIVSILKTRKVVKQYIGFNLTTFAIIMIGLGSYAVMDGISIAANAKDFKSEIPFHIYMFGILIWFVVTAILTLIGWFIYKLLYGILLKRLNKNYDELKKLDF